MTQNIIGEQAIYPDKSHMEPTAIQFKSLLQHLPIHLQHIIELYALLGSLHNSSATAKIDDRPFLSMNYSKSIGVIYSADRRFTYREQVMMNYSRALKEIDLEFITWCLQRDRPQSLFFINQDLLQNSHLGQ